MRPLRTDLSLEIAYFSVFSAPINPLDLLVLSNKHPVKPHYYHNEEHIPGVARDERVGSKAATLQHGDYVIPRVHGIGTWRTEAVVPATALLKMSRRLETSTASLLRTGCVMAYLLLETNRELQPGDWIVINAATGWIARMAIQLARLKGCPSICVIRDREHHDTEAARKSLREQDAAIVVLLVIFTTALSHDDANQLKNSSKSYNSNITGFAISYSSYVDYSCIVLLRDFPI